MLEMTPLKRACKIVGGQSALARLISRPDGTPLTPQAIQYWCHKNRVPAERVLLVEAATEGQVTRYELRPDLYPRGALIMDKAAA